MREPIKIVVSGPVGAGKTTFIHSLSEIPVVSTDEGSTELIGKQLTTVALDFGMLEIDDCPIHLFGTPGQERFDFMWEVLCQGASGLIVLIAGDRPATFLKARHILEFITSQISIPFIIGITRQDLPSAWRPADVADFLRLPGEYVMAIDARDTVSCIDGLYEIFSRIIDSEIVA